MEAHIRLGFQPINGDAKAAETATEAVSTEEQAVEPEVAVESEAEAATEENATKNSKPKTK